MELKDTLKMMKTPFEMKGNLASKEPLILKRWQDIDLYNLIQKKNSKRTPFIFHDGPPYANNSIHTGHSLNKVLKDIVVRYRGAIGYSVPYIPGWDTHGLPIEQAVQKKGINRKQMDLVAYRKHCRDYANEQVAIQMGQMKRLGLIADFDNCYKTLDKDIEAAQVALFAKLIAEGVVYKGLKPVYWSPVSESALAEAEIEYHDHQSTAIYVKFPVLDGKGIVDIDVSFLIWTTTPWTLPANLAICLNKDFTYGIYQTEKGKLLFLTSLAKVIAEKLELKECKLLKTISGKDLEYVKASHPFYSRESLVILGDHVTNDTGTGCVHTAPGHGEDDYRVGRVYNLDILSPVDSLGRMTEEAGEFLVGLPYDKANEVIVNHLEEKGKLLKKEVITHSYPHDWRYHKPIIFRATNQWFINLSSIKGKLLEEIKKVKWYPSWGEKRLSNMMETREEWCVSRQRAWGVPIPIIYKEDGTPIFEQKVLDHIVKIFKEKGSDAWYEYSVNDLLPADYPKGNYTKELDIMDVWFDSGCTHTTMMKERGYGFPCDLYFEGTDQFRGWFNASLINSVLANGVAPFKTVVTHGMVLDGKGEKMSKSIGNTIDPLKITNEYGADVLRLWVASVDYSSDVRISDDIIKQVAEMYRKIRNTFRFLLGNLNELKLIANWHPTEVVDKMIINKLHQVVNFYHEKMSDYQFAEALNAIVNFLTNDLSSLYLDISKDILYCSSVNDKRRQDVQMTLDYLIKTLLPLVAIFIPYTAEEIYDHSYFRTLESVHLIDLPKSQTVDAKLLDQYAALTEFRAEVLKELENLRRNNLIRSSQEAFVDLTISEERKKLLDLLSMKELERFLIVSKVNMQLGEDKIVCGHHQGHKCPRCWNYFDEISELCPRCGEVIKDYE